PYLDIQCGLGEGPYWEEATNTLRFVDIVKQKVYALDLTKGPSSLKVLVELTEPDTSIGTTADIEGDDEHFVFGGKRGYGIFNRKTAQFKLIKKYWSDEEIAQGKEKTLRGNDGAVDTQGRYWVGTMNDPLVKAPEPEGTLFRLDPDGTLHRMMEGVHIPNGMSWTADDKHMYFTDSPSKNIYKFDFDVKTGNISNKRVFYHVPEEHGVPDGHVLDEQGYMWAAIHGAGKVIRLSPEGKVVAEIIVPTRCPTCPAFAGEDLIITSSEEEMPDKFPNQKYQGRVFKVHVGVKGMKPNRFRWLGDKAV
ncbi:hypothetical protein K490DRAFT_38430, partial [Saccharata proteae CBS 121410]